MSERPVYIYGLKDPRTGVIRYVGKTVDPGARFSHHLACYGRNTHRTNWIAQLKRNGLKPEMVILETTDRAHWQGRECYWIAQGRASGWNLTNVYSGGEGKPEAAAGKGASAYSLRNNWEWAKAWYADFQRGYALRPERPEDDQMMLAAQRTLAEVVGQILAAPPEQQAAMLARFD